MRKHVNASVVDASGEQLTSRPRTECDLRDAMKLIASGAASCLHCHSAHDSRHGMGQFGWVSVFRKIAFALCSLKAATQCNFRSGQVFEAA